VVHQDHSPERLRHGAERDLVAELFTAASGSGLHVGLFYSLPEWVNPARRPANAMLRGESLGDEASETSLFNQKLPRNAYTQRPVRYTGYIPIGDYATGQVIPQIHELISRFHPSVLWCDIGGNGTYFESNEWIADLYNSARATNPDGVAVDDRCGDVSTHHDYNTVEYGAGTAASPFEATRGIGRSFGYNAQETTHDYLTRAKTSATLVTTVSDGGNLLLDIGLRADGTIPAVMIDRLRALGTWLRINGEAI
jgi:alpha-L-fucosidase